MSELVYLVPLVALYILSIVVLVAQIGRPDLGSWPPRPSRAPHAPEHALRLWIEGTERLRLRSTGFLAAFGLDARRIHDIRVYEQGGALASFPARLITLLFDLYMHGAVRGADAMALLYHGRPLGEDEALYFALVDLPPEPTVVAFIDRRHERNDHAPGG